MKRNVFIKKEEVSIFLWVEILHSMVSYRIYIEQRVCYLFWNFSLRIFNYRLAPIISRQAGRQAFLMRYGLGLEVVDVE